MRALVIQHDHVSPPGPIGERLVEQGYELVLQQLLTKEQIAEPGVEVEFPPAADFDLIVPMGAVFSVYDEERIGSWLKPDLDLLREADAAGVPVLGICFGGQLLAKAHGGSVVRSEHPEIGWVDVETNEPGLVSEGPWFEWHYDRWELPPDAREVARNARASQAFVLRRNLAVQFHPELTSITLEGWLGFDGLAEVDRLGLDAKQMYADTLASDPASRLRAHALVDGFLAGPARA
jgi:GMP synthase-like glutamine amidotransferase